MVMVLLTPLVYLYIKYLKNLGIFLLGIFWFCNYWFHIPGLSIAAIFLFTAGAWFSINEKSLLIDSKKISNTLFIAYPIFIVIDFITKNNNYNVFIHNAGIIIGLLFWFSLVQKLLANNVVKLNNFITQSSFFIFAFHEPLLTIIKKLVFAAIKPEKEATLIFLYFAIIFLVIIISLTIYYFLRLLLPKFCQVITGGR
jgi:hypothetical protein